MQHTNLNLIQNQNEALQATYIRTGIYMGLLNMVKCYISLSLSSESGSLGDSLIVVPDLCDQAMISQGRKGFGWSSLPEAWSFWKRVGGDGWFLLTFQWVSPI